MNLLNAPNVPLKLYSDVINFGDSLGLSICQKINPKLNFQIIQPYEDCSTDNLLTIGSILKGADINSYVWGSGFIDSNEYLHSPPKAIHAVRGPLTNKKIKMQGLKECNVYGDPACLVKIYYSDNTVTKYKYGLIPHYVDKDDPRLAAYSQNENVLIIDVQQPVEIVLQNIKSCSYILSSSLHGLICADAFAIPALYMHLSNKLAGNGFKFVDYFESCGRKKHTPYYVDDSISFHHAHKKFENFNYKINCHALINCFPIQPEFI